jgi:LPXTG-site transpeptidase (sortase) family protein
MTTARTHPARLLALLVGVVLALVALVGPASGYIGQAPVQIGLTGPSGPVACADRVTLTATVVDTGTGAPVAEQIVDWELTDGAQDGDALSGATSITDTQGMATIQLSFGASSGAREVSATVTVVTTPILVRCDVGLPQTALARPEDDAVGPMRLPTTVDPRLPVRALRIPRLGIEAPILEGDGTDVPLDAVAHHPATTWPGEGSNSYLYGHAREGLFGALWQARTGDLVEVELADGRRATYRVTEVRPLVAWDDLSVLAPSPTERLTLQTCVWYDLTSPRLVVIAEPATTAS